MEFNIRRLWRGDIMVLATCWSRGPDRIEFTKACSEWLDSTDPGEIIVFTEKITGKLVGVTGWYPMGNGEAFLRWHGVLEEFRRQKVSTTMLAWIASQIALYGCNKLYETGSSTVAIHHFLKCGFVKVDDPAKHAEVAKEAGRFDFLLVLENTPKPNPWKDVKRNQEPLIYSPASGLRMPVAFSQTTPEEYRKDYPEIIWMFHPYSGNRREPDDVKSDPLGYAIVP